MYESSQKVCTLARGVGPESVTAASHQQRRHAKISVSVQTVSQHGNSSQQSVNDLLLAADQGQVSAICLLDLSTVFNTINHSLLLKRLQKYFSVKGCWLEWFCLVYQAEAIVGS